MHLNPPRGPPNLSGWLTCQVDEAEGAGGVAGEDVGDGVVAQSAADNFGQDVAVVDGDGQVAFVQRFGLEARPAAEHPAAAHTAAQQEHDVAMAMVSAGAAVFLQGPAKFAHDDDRDAPHPRAQVAVKGMEAAAQLA